MSASACSNSPFKWFGSIAMTHLLRATCCHLLAGVILHLRYLNIFFIISNICFQCFMFQISKHYLCICSGRLNVPLSCIKQCVNASKCRFCVSSALHRSILIILWYWFHWRGNSPNARIWLKGWCTLVEKKTYCELITQNTKNIIKFRSQLSTVIIKISAQ